MSCGVDLGHGSDPESLWLWYRLAAAALIRLLACKLPYAAGAALKTKKKIVINIIFFKFEKSLQKEKNTK